MSVPKNGGLNLAVVTHYEGESKGLPSTVIHLLPVEVMVFVDMLPYYFLNRGDTSHTFWTSLGAILNLKYWIEDGLDNKDEQFLTFVLNHLEGGNLHEVLADVATFVKKQFVQLDVESLCKRKFQIQDERVSEIDFCKLLLNQIFHLKYKLVDWEGTDNFLSPAQVVPREPPKIVYCITESVNKAVYDLGSLNNLDGVVKHGQTSTSTVSSQDGETEFFELSQSQGEKRKLENSESRPEEKRVRVTDEEMEEIMKVAELIHNDPDDMQGTAPTILESQSSEFAYIPPGQGVQNGVTLDSTEKNVAEVLVGEVHERKEPIHLHFHFGECKGINVITYETYDKSFKLSIESKPLCKQ